jgi:hypothetical protein
MVDGLIEAGVDEEAAGIRIAKLASVLGCELPNAQQRAGKRQKTADHVRLLNWRKEVGRADERNSSYKEAREVRRFWQQQRRKFSKKHGHDPRSCAEAMIKNWEALYQPQKV